MEDDQLFQNLLPNETSTSQEDVTVKIFSSNSNVILRLCCIFFIGIISLWADYAASKGFEITIINDMKESSAKYRFTVFYISDDKATRIIQNTSSFVQNILHPNHSYPINKLQQLTLRFTTPTGNLSTELATVKVYGNLEVAITLSPSLIMEDPKRLDFLVKSMILEGMARVWLWNGGEGTTPPWVLDGLVEYIKGVAGYGCFDGWKLQRFGRFCLGDEDPMSVALFLDYSEGVKKGFIQRLNQGLKDGWRDRTVQDALGMPLQILCYSLSNSTTNGFSSS